MGSIYHLEIKKEIQTRQGPWKTCGRSEEETIMETTNEERKVALWSGFLFTGILMITIGVIFVISEIHGGIKFCQDNEGKYSFSTRDPFQYCNGEPMRHYKDGWDFERHPNEVEWSPNE